MPDINPLLNRNPALKPKVTEVETSAGRRWVGAARGDEIWVTSDPLTEVPRPLSPHYSEPPDGRTMVFTVLRDADGNLDVVLRNNPRRRQANFNVEFQRAKELAERYAADNVEYMDELRVLLRDERIEGLKWELGRVEERTPLAEWSHLAEDRLSALPEPWQGLIRRTEPTLNAFRAAPAPLGPLVTRGFARGETELAVVDVLRKLQVIEGYRKTTLASMKAPFVNELNRLRKQIARDTDVDAYLLPAPA